MNILQTLEMLKKFKSKLFSARGAFEGGGASEDEEEKAPPTAAEDEVGVAAESHDQQGITSEDALKWYADH